MSARYFVGTVSGWLEPATGGTRTPPPITAIVFDRLANCRNVASYRSEDEVAHHRTKQETIGRALQKANEHARRLNEEEARDGVVG